MLSLGKETFSEVVQTKTILMLEVCKAETFFSCSGFAILGFQLNDNFCPTLLVQG